MTLTLTAEQWTPGTPMPNVVQAVPEYACVFYRVDCTGNYQTIAPGDYVLRAADGSVVATCPAERLPK